MQLGRTILRSAPTAAALIVLILLVAAPAGAAPRGSSGRGGPTGGGPDVVVTSQGDSGPGTLRAAIAGIGSDSGTVSFAADVHRIELSAPIVVRGRALTLTGPGVDQLEISGRDTNRIFELEPAANLTITGATLAHGRHLGPPGDRIGGPGEGGAIYNRGKLVLNRVSLVANSAVGGPSSDNRAGPGYGGAIYNRGELVIENSLFADNEARGSDRHGPVMTLFQAGGHAAGGAIDNEGSLRITTTEFRDNRAIGAKGATVVFFMGDHGDGGGNAFGGAIYNGTAGESLWVNRSTFAGNRALGGASGFAKTAVEPAGDAAGGAIFTRAEIQPHQRFVLDDSTVVGNVAKVGDTQDQQAERKPAPPVLGAGAIQVLDGFTAWHDDTIALDTGLADVVTASKIYVANTILGGCAGAGMISSDGTNLDYGNSCKLSGPSDLVNTNAKLLGLGEHGGPTRTDPIAFDSPAVDAGFSGFAPGQVDQRGLPRPVRVTTRPLPPGGNGSDIGAFEIQAPPPPPPAVKFELRPRSLAFGGVPVGTVSKFLELNLVNTGDLPFDVGAVKIAGKDVDQFSISSETCAAIRLAPGAECRVRVRFSPEEAGIQSAEINLAAKVPGGPLTVPVQGTGT